MKKTIVLFIVLFGWMLNSQGWSQTITPIENGLIHEAYLQPVTGIAVLDAIPQEPPPPINEKIPAQTDLQTSWIKGYWAWSVDQHDYVWVSGVWRRPPPGQKWIEGFWQRFDEGWVYIRGFWSSVEENDLSYLPLAPPDPLEEDIPVAPNENMFWVPGYWFYSTDLEDYEWIGGEWMEMDPNWILVPAHYVWRPEGYVFIFSYWDWPIDQRGKAYATVRIDAKERTEVIYEPQIMIDPVIIVKSQIVYYPNYLYFYYHHYHFHPEFWTEAPFVPPWWGWASWWGFSWHDHWGLWWWYSHPGYPQPYWMNAQIAQLLPPPQPALFQLIKKITPPSIVTEEGVVTSSSLLHAISLSRTGKISDRVIPIVSNKKQVQERLNEVIKKEDLKPKVILRPEGKELPGKVLKTPPPKPEFKDASKQISPETREKRGTSLQEKSQKRKEAIKKEKLPPKPSVDRMQSPKQASQQQVQQQTRRQQTQPEIRSVTTPSQTDVSEEKTQDDVQGQKSLIESQRQQRLQRRDQRRQIQQKQLEQPSSTQQEPIKQQQLPQQEEQLRQQQVQQQQAQQQAQQLRQQQAQQQAQQLRQQQAQQLQVQRQQAQQQLIQQQQTQQAQQLRQQQAQQQAEQQQLRQAEQRQRQEMLKDIQQRGMERQVPSRG
jgi:DNA segregation ATPase FtsK/SpoIIIE-like protein